jgi:hypothetical protein
MERIEQQVPRIRTATTAQPGAARASRRKPNPEALSVTDGTEHVVMVVEGIEHDGRTFAAFDADGHLIGWYPTCAEAMRAYPRKAP